MDRRSLIKLMVALPFIAVARRAPAVADGVVLQRSAIAGFQYYDGDKLWSRLRVGDRVDLRAEPANRYDAFAVEVYWNQRKVGYLPRRENVTVAQLLARGAHVEGRIASLRRLRDPWERVGIDVVMVEPSVQGMAGRSGQ